MSNIKAKWLTPFAIRKGLRDDDLPWVCDRLDAIPSGPGIYVFGRRHGECFEPHYVGKAKNLQKRVGGQLANGRLIQMLTNAKTGGREVIVCELQPKRGQPSASAIGTMEKAVIRAALTAGHALLNKQLTRQPVHEITFLGNRTGTGLSGRRVAVPKNK